MIEIIISSVALVVFGLIFAIAIGIVDALRGKR
jgi:hypothetical protein